MSDDRNALNKLASTVVNLKSVVVSLLDVLSLSYGYDEDFEELKKDLEYLRSIRKKEQS